ncbi:hypothetical protein LCGC14_1089680 [marine sediment metagenome]|uniref:DUF3784 domain-containing protein n=2 Tax=root TaxID=1 RepID=A0A831QS53_9FLAO|nr:DUF3784 domain-containing protein [Pricia sp.]HEA22286.1 DUF3784 domain-containing protein [Pricia antarctica]
MIQIAIFLVVLGAGIKYGKAYFLIAGYNTMPREAKQKYDIEGIANMIFNVLLAMAILIGIGYFLADWLELPKIEKISFFGSFLIGIPYLLFRVNSKEFKVNP